MKRCAFHADYKGKAYCNTKSYLDDQPLLSKNLDTVDCQNCIRKLGYRGDIYDFYKLRENFRQYITDYTER